jgi:hypothetical protein
MKHYTTAYMLNQYIDLEGELFTILKKLYKTPADYAYGYKADKCIIHLSKELSENSKLIKLLEKYNFEKVY